MRSSLLLALASTLASSCLAHLPRLDLNALRELASDIPRELLDSALHNHLAPKYRDGVFEHVSSAIEALHDQNPQLASALVDDAVAKHDLKKRQDTRNNATTVTSTSVTEVTVSGTTSTSFVETTTIVPAPTGNTSPPPSTSNPPATSNAPSPSSSSPPPSSSAPAPAPAPTSSSQTPTSAPSPSRFPTTLLPTGHFTSNSMTFDATGTGIVTGTGPSGSTTLITYTPNSVVSEVVYSTSTLPDGAPVTVTGFLPTGTDSGNGDGQGARGTMGAQLQAGGAEAVRSPGRWGLVWVVMGVVMGVGVVGGL